jgi:hypothetical protein
VRKVLSRMRQRWIGGRLSGKRSLSLLVAGSFVCLLGLVTGLEGGLDGALTPAAAEAVVGAVAFPAAAQGGPVPVSTVQPQEVLSLPGLSSVDVDVVVFSTQTSGLAAVRELVVGAPHLRVALISCGNLLESPLAQGLGVEDARDIGRVKGGFYDEWRQAVIDSYARRGLKAFNSSGRFVYEPEVAAQALWSYVRGPNVLFYAARLLANQYPVLHRRERGGRPGPHAGGQLSDRPSRGRLQRRRRGQARIPCREQQLRDRAPKVLASVDSQGVFEDQGSFRIDTCAPELQPVYVRGFGAP